MTDLNELFQVIESREMEFRLSAASGLRVFVKGAVSQPEVTHLIDVAGSDTLVSYGVLLRLTNLASQECDPRYENPYDTAIAIYFLVLREVNSSLIGMSAISISGARNLWWANKLTRQMRDRTRRDRAERIPTISFVVPSSGLSHTLVFQQEAPRNFPSLPPETGVPPLILDAIQSHNFGTAHDSQGVSSPIDPLVLPLVAPTYSGLQHQITPTEAGQ